MQQTEDLADSAALVVNYMERLLTAKDIQEIFSVSKPQAYALMHSRGFPSVSLNDRVYVEEEELEKWLKANKGKRYIY